MIAFGGTDDIRASARACAARGEWSAVRSLLASEPASESEPDMLLLAAEADLRLGMPREAAERLRLGWPAFVRSGDGAALRRANNLLGAAAFELGNLDESHAAFSRALELADADGDHLLVARATNNLGAIANLRGQREAALAHFQLAIPAYQQLGHAVGLAESCHNLAIAYRDARDLDAADEYERRAIEFAREGGSAHLEVMARAGRAELSLLRGDAAMAEVRALSAAAECRVLNDRIGEADAIRLAGESRLALGNADGSLAALDEAVEIATQHGAALVRGEALRARARVHLARGARDAALDDAQSALEVFEQLGAADDVVSMAELLRAIVS